MLIKFNSIFNEIFDIKNESLKDYNFNEILVGKDTNKGRVWEIELSGVFMEDLSIEVNNNTIYVKGIRKLTNSKREYNYSIPLCGYGPEIAYSFESGLLKILAKKFTFSSKVKKIKLVKVL